MRITNVSKDSKPIVDSCRGFVKEAGERPIIVGLSGGADSVALLAAMKLSGAEIIAVHCNFNLRGDESIRDRDFVKDLCSRLDVRLICKEFDTPALQLKGESLEMTCRRLRYDLFDRIREQENAAFIAIAHNSDDNAETLFINLLRGCGTTGLKGMELRSGNLIRPLLGFNKERLMKFLGELGEKYVTDSTNLESDFRRNFLRNEIFPRMRDRWEGFDKALIRSQEILRKENRILKAVIENTLASHPGLLPWDVIMNFPDPETLIFHFIKPHGGTAEIAGEIAAHAVKPEYGKSWGISDRKRFVSTSKGLKITELDRGWKEPECRWEKLDRSEYQKQITETKHNEIIFLPRNAERYEWQAATPAMTMEPLGLKGTAKVWKILKDAGIPAVERSLFPVLTSKTDGMVIWLPSLKRSRHHLIHTDTPQIFSLSLLK